MNAVRSDSDLASGSDSFDMSKDSKAIDVLTIEAERDGSCLDSKSQLIVEIT